MADFTNLLGIRIFISCIGCIGNLVLVLSITHVHAKMSSIRSFEVFLLGLAVSNLEEIVIVNVYDIIILEDTSAQAGTWSCRMLKFLTICGELGSILFTVVICVFRYEKVRNATERVNLPIFLDNITSAVFVSAFCFALSLILGTPIFVIDVDMPGNATKNNCAPDFFHCNEVHCPMGNYIYKYAIIVICNLVPMSIVTVGSCLIISVLLRQRKKVEPGLHSSRNVGKKMKSMKSASFNRSTVAVLAAMGLFQVDWSLYLFIQLNPHASNIDFWNEMKFFISTSYTSISPYMFGIGNNLFSFKQILRK
ncbi:unnamed protein product [Knipowitschia caucasica]